MTEVLIVGAGPVGLSCAIDLLRRGVTCRIIEKSPAFAVGTRARGISARTQEIFESWGLLDSLRQHAEPRLPTVFYDRTGEIKSESAVAAPTTPTPDIPYPNALMVSQQNTDAVLRAKLRELGGTVEIATAFTSISQNPDFITASVNGEGRNELIQAQYLIGCDGGRGAVRNSLGIPYRSGSWEDQTSYLLGNLDVEGLDPDRWHVWTDNGWGYVTLQPIIHGHTWLFVATVPPTDATRFSSPSIADFETLYRDRLPCSTISFENLTWHSFYRRSLRIVSRYRMNRAFLAGDAAHLGVEHGMNVGIQEVHNLGWKLAAVLKRNAPDQLLDTYHEEREPVACAILEASLARDLGKAGPAQAAGTLTKAILNQDPTKDPTQLSVCYPDSRLSRDWVTAKLAAGQRAPDVFGLRRADGQMLRLFDLIGGAKFILLAFGSPGKIPSEPWYDAYRIVKAEGPGSGPKTLVDVDSQAHRIFGVSGELNILIRPDGHLAGSAEAAQLDRQLTHVRRLVSGA